METVERHVPQLLLRGEQVILILKIEWLIKLPKQFVHLFYTQRYNLSQNQINRKIVLFFNHVHEK